jgi:cell division protein FtsW (lipid II flippase)
MAYWILAAVGLFFWYLVYVPHIGWAATAGRDGGGTVGAHRWIGLPHLPHFQPSELSKLAVILFLAAYGERYQRQMGTFEYGAWPFPSSSWSSFPWRWCLLNRIAAAPFCWRQWRGRCSLSPGSA